jgi:hypothetical protein
MTETFFFLNRVAQPRLTALICHPERSEGPVVLRGIKKQVLRFAQDDNTELG